MSVADSVSFNNFCELCVKISNAPQEKKVDLIQNYIECWKKRAKDLEKSRPGFVNCSFYPVLRFLLPHLDRERGAYGIKEHNLAKIYIRILSLPKDGKDAVKFLGYRAPKSPGSGGGDFAEVAYWILKRRCTEGKQLSIEEVNKHLDAIAEKHASSEPRAVEAELISLLKATSALEQKWLIRILLKDMKLGVGQNGILKAYHPDARDLYDASNNLQKVCEVLKDPGVRLHEIDIELFSPFKPMLSEEFNIQKIDGYLKKSKYFFVETKLDGERFQIHKNEGDYKYFSRNGYDYTTNFGTTRFEGSLTPKLADQFSPDVRSCILDGEMMAWNKETSEFATKAQNVDVKSLKDADTHRPCFCAFDVLYYNGQVLTNEPLTFRLEILNKLINPSSGTVCFVNRKRASSKEEIINSLNEAIDNREEGIVMKEFMSVYKPNARRNGGWYKMKPEYIDGLSDTLDLIILGGYYGSGRHQGRVSHFLLGVAFSVQDDDSKLFYSVARVGSGYTITELAELQAKLQPHWKEVKAGEMPPGMEWGKEKPEVWIPPDKSFILEIKAAEITSSALYRTGYTLRFPRVNQVRYDKCWRDCLTLEEFEEKRKMASGKLAPFHMAEDEKEGVRKKRTGRLTKGISLKHQMLDVGSIERVSSLLHGKEICVFTGFDKIGKIDVERKIIEYGGTLVQNPGKNTLYILAESNSTAHINNVLQAGLYDFVKTSWFYSQLNPEATSFPELKPYHFLAMSALTREKFGKSYDEYGDHFTIFATKDSLLQLSLMTSDEHVANMSLSLDNMYDLDVELFSDFSPFSFFRLCTAYFDRFLSLENPSSEVLPHLETVELSFRFYGGRCSRRICNRTTHVVVFSKDLSRVEELKRRNQARKEKFHIVTEKWVQSSILNKSLSNEVGL